MKNERGSILLFTLFIFFILFILGFTILSISVVNYTIQGLNYKSKQCFYITEGGLDLVYGQVTKEIQSAMKDGKNKMNYFIEKEYDDFIQNEMNKELRGEDSLYLELVKRDDHISYKLNQKKIEEKFNEEFQKGYKNYFLGNKKYVFIRNIESIEDHDLKINLVGNEVIMEGNKIKFQVSSLYEKDRMKQEITLDFYIKIGNKEEENIKEFIELKRWIRRR